MQSPSIDSHYMTREKSSARKKAHSRPRIKTVAQRRLTARSVQLFREKIWKHYREQPRKFPWRETTNPYHILVSEIMLQQTQTRRVMQKYEQFINAFPDFVSLAKAPLRAILGMWQGLGYNRRALSLKKLAEIVLTKHGGVLPTNVDELARLPGIGRATASAVAAFAFNQPTVFIETNIRRVFIHHFFKGEDRVEDARLHPLVLQTLDVAHPREWYYALMDYGAMLKKTHPNPNRRSAHYQKQAPFHGSNRQIRGMILKALVKKSGLTLSSLAKELGVDPDRLANVLCQLEKEGFIKKDGRHYRMS